MAGASGPMPHRAAGRDSLSACRANTKRRYRYSLVEGKQDMPQTILVVDDEPRIVDLVTTILEGQGYRVVEAPDGDAALIALREQLPDLVLLDVMLPGRDGFSVLKEI